MADLSKIPPRTWAAVAVAGLATLLLLPLALGGQQRFDIPTTAATVVQPPGDVAVVAAGRILDPLLPAFAGPPPVDPFTLEARVAIQQTGALPLPSPPALTLPAPPLLPLPVVRSPEP